MALIKVRSNEDMAKAILKDCIMRWYAKCIKNKIYSFNFDLREIYMKYLNVTCYPEFIGVSLHFEKKQRPQP